MTRATLTSLKEQIAGLNDFLRQHDAWERGQMDALVPGEDKAGMTPAQTVADVLNRFDKRTVQLEEHYSTLNGEMGRVQGLLEEIDNRLSMMQWLIGATTLTFCISVVLIAAKVLLGSPW